MKSSPKRYAKQRATRWSFDTAAAILGAAPALRGELAQSHLLWAEAKSLYDQRRAGADERFARAETVLRRAGSPLAWWSAYYQTVGAYWAGDQTAARSRFAELRREATDAGYLRAQGYVDWMNGLLAVEEGRLSDGVAHYRSAVSRLDSLGFRDSAAFVRTLVADALLRLGEPRGAFNLLHPALPEIISSSSPRYRKALGKTAEAIAAVGHLGVALYFYDRAVDSALATEDASLASESLYARAEALHRLGFTSKAERDLDEARRWLAAIDDATLNRMVEARIAQTEGYVLGHREPAASVDRLSSALEYFAETGAEVLLPGLYVDRARQFLTQGNVTAAEDDLVRGVDLAEKQRSTVTETEWRVSFASVVRSAVEELLRLRLDQDRPADEILPLTDLLRDAGSFVSAEELVRARGVWKNVDEVRLPGSTAFVSFSVLEDRLLAWTLRSGAVWLEEVPVSRSELRLRVEEAAELNRPLAETEDARAWLYENLIAPIADELVGAETVYLALDAFLNRVPFAGLFDRGVGEYLIERHALAITPAAAPFLASAAATGERPSPRLDSVLAVGDPRLDPRRESELPRLPRAENEARAVAALYPRAEILIAEDATKENVTRLMGTTNVLHFAGHALANPDNPAISRLVLAGDSPEQPVGLYASEIREMELSGTELVVLAACGAARTSADDSSGLLTLAAPFLEAGAGVVVASTMDIEDSLASQILSLFHARLRSAPSDPEALRQAQIAYHEARPTSTTMEWLGLRAITLHYHE